MVEQGGLSCNCAGGGDLMRVDATIASLAPLVSTLRSDERLVFVCPDKRWREAPDEGAAMPPRLA